MNKKIQAVRGMHDLLPAVTSSWVALEQRLAQLVSQAGYQEIRTPIIESSGLFQRAIGETSDIVSKEMYSFTDRNGEALTLRPEGTASCIRAGIEHGLFYNQTQRWFYYGPMFRYERPQKGRYRQFYQFGLEAYGFHGPIVDAELLLLTAQLWEQLQLTQPLSLQINNLGSLNSRLAYRQALVDYLQANYQLLDLESQQRLLVNPLRILDSKNPNLQPLLQQAPKILDYLDSESIQYWEQLLTILQHAKLPYVINPYLVRGLDYYTSTVFEWVTQDVGAQNAVCAGGRYDDLVSQFGGPQTPAIGCALGIERLLNLINPTSLVKITVKIYCILLGGPIVIATGLRIVEQLRIRLTAAQIVVNCAGGDLRKQLQRADKSGAIAAIILGEEELQANEIQVKYLRVTTEALIKEQRLQITSLPESFVEQLQQYL